VIQRHYEVVVLGRGIGALTAAALLARRDFTVLLAGHGAPAPTYRVGDRILCRRVSTVLAGTSPTWKRVVT
jgi:glycine/D-amino acid oxidase-like deaminating enzyme